MDTYEKKYKNALTIAQSRFKIEKDESVLTCLRMMFPELRESEDERIRKAIIELLKEVEEDETYTGRQHIPDMLAYLEKQKEQKSVEKPSREECITKFKTLCDAYDIKLPNREYDIYGLCEDLHKFFGDIQKPAEWSEEDKEKIDHLSFLLTLAESNGFITASKRTELGDFLIKSIRPQPHEEKN